MAARRAALIVCLTAFACAVALLLSCRPKRRLAVKSVGVYRLIASP